MKNEGGMETFFLLVITKFFVTIVLLMRLFNSKSTIYLDLFYSSLILGSLALAEPLFLLLAAGVKLFKKREAISI